MNETLELSRWIYDKLSGDSTILTEVGNHPVLGIPQIFAGVAPQDATGKYIVFRLIGTGKVRKSDSGREKIYVKANFSIMIWSEGHSYSPLSTGANKIDELFSVDHLLDDDAIVSGCCAKQQIIQDYSDDGKKYVGAGSIVEFFVHGAS